VRDSVRDGSQPHYNDATAGRAGRSGKVRSLIRQNAKIIRMDAVKKTWLIDPELVRQAQKISGARTETETVTRALREIVVRDEIDKAFRRHSSALAGLEAILPDPSRTRKK